MKPRLSILLALALGLLGSHGATAQPTPFFCIGADVSEIPASEARGSKYYDIDGTEMDPLQVMAKHGFNVIRLRLFVNPEAPRGYSRDGFCGTESTIAFAKRIKAAGMQFALNFHYSDTWADPDKQYKPSKWEGLTGKALEDKLYQYTKETLQAFKAAGAAPEIVQVGNEISHGLVWPEGKVMDDATEENWAACMGLYKAGQRAVHEVLPDAKLQV
nr:arabinogalactan endo-1,4-beta-galactosidase [Bacteroidales bacterium]